MAGITILASAVNLTTTPTASSNTAYVGGLAKHCLTMEWTPGTAGNKLSITIQGRRKDSAVWIQEASFSTDAARLRTAHTLSVTAANTTAIGLYHNFDMAVDEIRVLYAESEDGSATKGSIKAWISSRAS